MAEIAYITRVLRPCFDLVNYSLSREFGLLVYHHFWSETRQTKYSMGVAVRLVLVLDLVKKMGRAKERQWREQRDESILKKFPKAFEVGFVLIHISSYSSGKTLLTRWR